MGNTVENIENENEKGFYNKAELVAYVYDMMKEDGVQINKLQTANTIDYLMDAIKEITKNGEEIRLKNFLTITTRYTPERNIQSKMIKDAKIPARYRLVFKPANNWKKDLYIQE